MNLKPTLAALIFLLTAIALPTAVQGQTTTGMQSGLGRIGNPVQGMTTTPIQPMTNPVQPMTTTPVTGMGVPPASPQNAPVSAQKPATPVPAPTRSGSTAKRGTTVSPLPGGAVRVPVGGLNVEVDPSQGAGNFLTSPGLPTVSLNPETPAQLPASSEDSGALLTSPTLPTVSLNPDNVTELSVPSPAPASSLTTPTLPTVSLNPEVPAELPATPTNTGSTLSEKSILPAKGDVTRLELGTPQSKVIEKLGNPVAYVMNKNGQTLYFKSGVAVFIKDGVVAVPDK